MYLDWLKYLSWFKYGNAALMINQWTGVEDIYCPVPSNDTSVPCIRTGEQVLVKFGFDEETLWFNVVCLIIMAVAFRTLAFLALLSKTIRRKK